MSDGRARRKGPEAGCLSIGTSQRLDGEQMAELVIEYPFKFRPNPCISIKRNLCCRALKVLRCRRLQALYGRYGN